MPGGLDRWAGHGLHAIMSASRLVVLAVPFLQVTHPRLPSPKSRHPGTLITVHSRRRPPPRLTAAVAASAGRMSPKHDTAVFASGPGAGVGILVPDKYRPVTYGAAKAARRARKRCRRRDAVARAASAVETLL